MIINMSEEEMKRRAEDYWTLKAMKQYGGGFVKALAAAAHQADDANLAIMKSAWSVYFTKYRLMGISLERTSRTGATLED